MKIGEFSQKYGVNKDTVRYYIKLGLLVPQTVGSQVHFGPQDEEDMARILQFKEMQMSLSEIRSLFYLRRMSNFIEPGTLEQGIAILDHKKQQIEEEQRQLAQSAAALEKEIQWMKAQGVRARKALSGIPFRGVPLLCCPRCHRQFQIKDAEISGKYIMQGTLFCPCGCEAKIRDGIVITGNVYTGSHDTPDLERKLYHETGPEFSIVGPRAPEYMLREIHKLPTSDKVIFEANINGFFFTYNFLPQLPHDCTYIIVDKYPEVLQLYKSLTETLYQDLDIVYIADAGEHLPLASDCIDIYVAFFGETEYGYYHKSYQLHDIASQLKDGASIIGAMPSFAAGSRSRQNLYRKYPEGNPRMCNMGYLREDYKKLGVELETELLGTVKKTTKHHMFTEHVDGEPMELYGYRGNVCKKS